MIHACWPLCGLPWMIMMTLDDYDDTEENVWGWWTLHTGHCVACLGDLAWFGCLWCVIVQVVSCYPTSFLIRKRGSLTPIPSEHVWPLCWHIVISCFLYCLTPKKKWILSHLPTLPWWEASWSRHLGGCRCMDMDGLLASQPQKTEEEAFFGHLTLASRWVACAGGKDSGSRAPNVECPWLKPWGKHLKLSNK